MLPFGYQKKGLEGKRSKHAKFEYTSLFTTNNSLLLAPDASTHHLHAPAPDMSARTISQLQALAVGAHHLPATGRRAPSPNHLAGVQTGREDHPSCALSPCRRLRPPVRTISLLPSWSRIAGAGLRGRLGQLMSLASAHLDRHPSDAPLKKVGAAAKTSPKQKPTKAPAARRTSPKSKH